MNSSTDPKAGSAQNPSSDADIQAWHEGERRTRPDEDIHGARTVLFSGDRGELRLDTRRALVQLLAGPAVDQHRHAKLWPVVVRDQAVLRGRLHELFLDLVVDHDQQVAFIRQISDEEVDAPKLLRRTKLTFIESALLLFLRQRLTQADTQGERAVVSEAEMLEHLGIFEQAANTDKSRFAKQRLAAIDKMDKQSLLRPLTSAAAGTERRYEVAPTLKLLFPAEEIQALTRTYDALLAEPHGPAAAETPPVEDEAE